MASSAIPYQDNSPSAGVINSLADLFLGKTQTQTGAPTSTTETVSDAGTKALVQSILGGTQGLSSIFGAGKSAGLYNSSTSKLLSDDLIARASAQAAALSKTTTTSGTKVGTTVNPRANGSLTAAGLVALQLAPKELKDALSERLGIKDLASKIKGTGTKAAAGTTSSGVGADVGNTAEFLGSTGSAIATPLGASIASGVGTQADIASAGASLAGDLSPYEITPYADTLGTSIGVTTADEAAAGSAAFAEEFAPYLAEGSTIASGAALGTLGATGGVEALGFGAAELAGAGVTAEGLGLADILGALFFL